jgi:hypothetical protein
MVGLTPPDNLSTVNFRLKPTNLLQDSQFPAWQPRKTKGRVAPPLLDGNVGNIAHNTIISFAPGNRPEWAFRPALTCSTASADN